MVSVNHRTSAAAFREPPSHTLSNSCYGSQFNPYVFILNSGYRTRYPLVSPATPPLPAGRRAAHSYGSAQLPSLTPDDLISFLKAIPNGRYRRGVRYPQWFLLLLTGQRAVRRHLFL